MDFASQKRRVSSYYKLLIEDMNMKKDDVTYKSDIVNCTKNTNIVAVLIASLCIS